MAQATLVEAGIDRVQEVLRNAEGEFEKLQKRFDKRRKQLEKDAEKRIKHFRSEFRKNTIVKRAETFQKDAVRQLEERVDQFLSRLQIASQGDIKKLDKKLGQISKKLSALEKTRGSSASS